MIPMRHSIMMELVVMHRLILSVAARIVSFGRPAQFALWSPSGAFNLYLSVNFSPFPADPSER